MNKLSKILSVVSMGLSLMGASMTGATALNSTTTDLGAFPSQFVKDGVFDGVIVVGATAASEDVVGAVDIGAYMQYELKKEIPVSLGGSDVMISSGIKIKGTGSQVLNYNESIGEIRSTAIDDNDMPVTLAQGRYTESEGANDNDETYTQTITFESNNGKVFHEQPDDGYDSGDYLELLDSNNIFTYELAFDSAIKYDTTKTEDDLKGTTLELQGNLYTITGVKTSGGKLDEITMMAGETVVWLTQDQPITKTVGSNSHTVKVVDVTDDEDSCGISVDGDMTWVTVGETRTVNGVKLGVLDAKAVHAQLQDVDVCELNVGATEIVLTDGDRLQKDGEDVRDGEVTIDGTAGNWEGFTISTQPEDNVYLRKNDTYVDPALGNIKIVMGGITTVREDIEIEVKGSKDVQISFENNDGKDVVIPLEIDPNGLNKIIFGRDDDKPLLFEGGTYTCATDIENCDGVELYSVTSGNTAHIIEVTNVDSGDNKIDLKDLTYGREYSDKTYTDGVASEIDLGSMGKIKLTLNEVAHTITATDIDLSSVGSSSVETNYGADLTLLNTSVSGIPVNVNYTTIFNLKENDNDNSVSETIGVDIKYDDVNDDKLKIKLTNSNFKLNGVGSNDKEDDDSGVQVYSTKHGTLVEVDDDNEDDILIQYPEEEVGIDVFIAPVSAQISTKAGSITTVTLPKLNVGAARLDTEISDYKAQNMILVGGSCANSVAASVLGNPYAVAGCEAGYKNNEAIIKLVDTGSGKVAMLVSGMSAMDTRRATRVIANPSIYGKFTGSEVVVTGTSLSDIVVSAPI